VFLAAPIDAARGKELPPAAVAAAMPAVAGQIMARPALAPSSGPWPRGSSAKSIPVRRAACGVARRLLGIKHDANSAKISSLDTRHEHGRDAAAGGRAAGHAPVSVAVPDDLQDISQLEALAKSKRRRSCRRSRPAALPRGSDPTESKTGTLQSAGRSDARLRASHARSGHDRTALPERQALASLCAGQNHRTSSAVVAAHAIVVGSVLKATDLRVEQHDISELPPGFLDDPAIAVGLTASRPISAAHS